MQMLKRGFGAAGLASLVLGFVAACGGGGGGGVPGIDRLGVTTGTINGFGSVIVNGVEYETNDADFDIDDGPGSQSDLKVGQQVTIEWDSTDDGVTRRAQSVSYDDLLEGRVTSIDPATQTLVVLGQRVIVDAATSFDDAISPRDLRGLAVSDVVEVSGLIDGNGAIRATRIDFSEGGDFEVRGIVERLDPDGRTFKIKDLTVNYAGVINPPVLANGLFVEVEGADGIDIDPGTLFATKVEIDDGISGAHDGDEGEVEGYITTFVSATDFSVSGVPVTIIGQITYEDGVPGDLALNVKVEVEGELNSSGVLVARKVEFKSGDDDDDGDDDSIDGRVAGNVTAVNTVAGTLAIAGVTVTVTAETRFEDQIPDAVDQSFGLDDINEGDYVEVRGDPGTGATLTAVIVERDLADTDGLLRGPASAVNGVARSLSVLGVPVTTDGGTQYRDAADNPIDNPADFFNAISNGSEVQVQFTQGGGVIVADELELEDVTDL